MMMLQIRNDLDVTPYKYLTEHLGSSNVFKIVFFK